MIYKHMMAMFNGENMIQIWENMMAISLGEYNVCESKVCYLLSFIDTLLTCILDVHVHV